MYGIKGWQHKKLDADVHVHLWLHGIGSRIKISAYEVIDFVNIEYLGPE